MSNRTIPATPKARKLAEEKNIDLLRITPSGKNGEIIADDVIFSQKNRVTPLALRIAQDRGIDISNLKGSGYGGKIYSFDLDNARETTTVAERHIRMTSMRRAIASAMSKSYTTIPQLTQNTEVDITVFNAFRKKINEPLHKEEHVSVNDLILKATAIALKEFERFRYYLIEDEYIVNDNINIGIAVALEDGLIVPVLKKVDQLSIHEIATESKRLSTAARKGMLSSDDLNGGIITVSNLGMYGIHSFTPIINAPEASILGVCAPIDRLALEGNEIAVHSFLILSLTYDHRILNGAEAALFASRIKKLLEYPDELTE